MWMIHSFIHCGDLYSVSSGLLLRSAPDPCTAKTRVLSMDEYKVCFLVYKSLNWEVPGYLRDYKTYSSASGLRLRSTDKHDLRVRRMKTWFGDCAFAAAGPSYWNSLPSVMRASDSVDSFKTGLKKWLFSRAYSTVS